MKCTILLMELVDVLLKAIVLMVFVVNAQEIQHTVLKLESADALQDIEIKEDSVLLVVDPIRSYPTDNAAVLLDSTPSMESAANATGTKCTTKALEYAEFHVMPRESITSKHKNVNAYLNSLN